MFFLEKPLTPIISPLVFERSRVFVESAPKCAAFPVLLLLISKPVVHRKNTAMILCPLVRPLRGKHRVQMTFLYSVLIWQLLMYDGVHDCGLQFDSWPANMLKTHDSPL